VAAYLKLSCLGYFGDINLEVCLIVNTPEHVKDFACVIYKLQTVVEQGQGIGRDDQAAGAGGRQARQAVDAAPIDGGSFRRINRI
jgi:hypothetical protein